jgi:hypothetical protein
MLCIFSDSLKMDVNGNMANLVLDDTDGIKELSDWLFGRVADDNDVVVDKVCRRNDGFIR